MQKFHSRAEWREENPLRKWRREQSHSQAAVASELEVTPQTITNWESGAYPPSTTAYAKLAELTGITNVQMRWNAWSERRPSLVS